MVDLHETVTAAREGCRDAFTDLVRATYDDTYSHALRLVGNAEDASDVAQDTYLRAFRAIARFRGESHVATWLYRITANSATSLLARRRRHACDPLDAGHETIDPRVEHDPSHMADVGDRHARVVDAIAQLPERLRAALLLRDVHDLPYDAIARELAISESAAKVRVHRARHRLRVALFDGDGSDPTGPGAGEAGPGDPGVSVIDGREGSTSHRGVA